MKDYSLMTSDQLKKENKKLNRLLILPNMLIAIIAAIACFAQMFMPFFEVSVTVDGDAVATVIDMVYDEDEEIVTGSDNEILNAVLTKSNVKKMTSTLDTTIAVELKGVDLLALAFASDEEVEDEVVSLIVAIVENMNIKEVLNTTLNETMPKVVSIAVTETIKTLQDELELTDEETAIIDECATEIEASVQKLADADTVTDELKETVQSEVKTSISDAMAAAGYSEENIESVTSQVSTYFDEFINAATDEDGSFSYITLIDNFDDFLASFTSSDSSSDDASAESAANEIAAIKYTLTDDETGGSSGTTAEDATSGISTSELSYYISLLDDPEALVEELLGESGFDEDTLQIIKLVSMALFIFLAVISALWAILVLLSVLHIFLPNKKVGMWYVKLFGGLAALVFFLVPLVAILVCRYMPALLAESLALDSAIFTTIGGALSFGGAEIIVLLCLLALWVVSIFICHPIKKRIKRCKKALKHVA